MGKRSKGSKPSILSASSGTSFSSNPIHSIHNKWRYYSRKNKNTQKYVGNSRHPSEPLVGNPWTYIEFFCGSDKFCNQIKNGDDDAKSKVLDIAKRRVVHQYYVVGILEQFEDTLRMFETMLPDFYSGAMTAWRSDYIQFRRNQTKTIKGEPLSDEARNYLAHNALNYESDFYWFCRFLFNERMRALQIEPSANTNT